MYDPSLPQAAHIRPVISSKPTQKMEGPPVVGSNEIEITRKNLLSYKKSIQLSEEEKNICVGLLLGDASLQTQDKGKTFRLKFQYAKKNEAYAVHVNQKLSKWCLQAPKALSNREMVSFQTISHQDLKIFDSIFYERDGERLKKKGISRNFVDNNLSAQGLAYWFMDDGGKRDYSENQGKGITLHTQCFTFAEVEELREGLQNKFNLDCKVGINKQKPVIHISGKSFETFLSYVDPYLENSMRQKLPSSRKTVRLD